MKYKTEEPVITIEEVETKEETKPQEKSIKDVYKKIILDRLELIEDSIRIVRDAFRQLDGGETND